MKLSKKPLRQGVQQWPSRHPNNQKPHQQRRSPHHKRQKPLRSSHPHYANYPNTWPLRKSSNWDNCKQAYNLKRGSEPAPWSGRSLLGWSPSRISTSRGISGRESSRKSLRGNVGSDLFFEYVDGKNWVCTSAFIKDISIWLTNHLVAITYLVAPESERSRKRNNAWWEIITTERSYVAQLDDLANVRLCSPIVLFSHSKNSLFPTTECHRATEEFVA